MISPLHLSPASQGAPYATNAAVEENLRRLVTHEDSLILLACLSESIYTEPCREGVERAGEYDIRLPELRIGFALVQLALQLFLHGKLGL